MPQVVGAAAERRPALRRRERGLPGLGPHGGVGGVLEDAAPGGLEDPPVRCRAVPPNMGAEQADEVGRNRDGAGLSGGAVLEAAFLPGGAVVGPRGAGAGRGGGQGVS